MLDENTILAGKQKNDLFSKLSTNERDYLSLDYETWMKHQQKKFISMRLLEKDAETHFRKKVRKYDKELSKMLYTKMETSGKRMIMIKADENIDDIVLSKQFDDVNNIDSEK